jgi:hypothetical protein
MVMSMKFRIELLTTTKLPFLILLASLSYTCKTPTEVSSSVVTEKTLSGNAKVLRLTYDATWSPNLDFKILESGSIHSSGNTYTIEYIKNSTHLKWLRISSTNQENKHGFHYLLKNLNEDPKVFYFPWKNSKISILLKQSQLDDQTIHCRWEGTYNGFLIIVEGEYVNSDNEKFLQIANKVHAHVNESLILY